MPKADDNHDILSYEDVLELLSTQAIAGSVTAAAALERALRAKQRKEEESVDEEFERLLTKQT